MTLLFCPALAGLYRCAKMLESLYLSVTTVTATSHHHTVKTGQPKGSPSLVGKSPLVGLWRFLLTLPGILAYGCLAAPQWVAGICSPSKPLATIDAIKRLFYCRRQSTQTRAASFRIASLVAQAGQLSGWPVSNGTGTANPAWAITNQEICSSGGSNIKLPLEATIMVATPAPSHPEFTFHFLAVRRADLRDTPHRESVTTPDELTARRLLARDFVLLFAGRVPSQGVRHV